MQLHDSHHVEWPYRSGEMATRLRDHRWQRSPLGLPGRWSARLRMAVELMLDSPLPTLIFWGPDGIALYNDECIAVLGSQHPALFGSAVRLGRNARARRIDEIASALQGGRSVVWQENWLPENEPTEAAPLRLCCVGLRDSHGKVSGVWVQCFADVPEQGAKETGRAGSLDIDTVGIAFFGPDGLITDANDAYLTMFGIDRAALLSATVRWGDGTAPEWKTLLHRAEGEYRQSGYVSPHEKECLRADGHRWWGLFGAKRLTDTEGVEYVVDISNRMRAERDLRDSERRMRSVMEGIPQIVWRSREAGHWTWVSPQWAETTGQPQAQSIGLGWLDMVHPDDRDEAHAVWDRASWEQAFEANYRLWHMGERRYRAFKTRATPVHDEAGEICEWFGTSTDVEDLQRLHSRQRVLVAELQHRTRNLLALVKAIAAQTIGRDHETRARFLPDFNDRLAALSRAQSLITRADSERVDLEGLLRTELAALRGARDGRVLVSGPAVDLPASHAQTLALATHELATNALKYGALTSVNGLLRVTWNTSGTSEQGRTLHLTWQESGVRIPDVPARRGFGRELIEDALCFTLSARTNLRFGPDGIACAIDLPLDELQTTESGGVR
jgi:PAS domain S-box-containing protein